MSNLHLGLGLIWRNGSSHCRIVHLDRSVLDAQETLNERLCRCRNAEIETVRLFPSHKRTSVALRPCFAQRGLISLQICESRPRAAASEASDTGVATVVRIEPMATCLRSVFGHCGKLSGSLGQVLRRGGRPAEALHRPRLQKLGLSSIVFFHSFRSVLYWGLRCIDVERDNCSLVVPINNPPSRLAI